MQLGDSSLGFNVLVAYVQDEGKVQKHSAIASHMSREQPSVTQRCNCLGDFEIQLRNTAQTHHTSFIPEKHQQRRP